MLNMKQVKRLKKFADLPENIDIFDFKPRKRSLRSEMSIVNVPWGIRLKKNSEMAAIYFGVDWGCASKTMEINRCWLSKLQELLMTLPVTPLVPEKQGPDNVKGHEWLP